MYEELVEQSNRSDSRGDLTSKRRVTEQDRLHNSLREMRDTNRELRQQNNELKDRIQKLEEEVYKKTTYINSIKGDRENE